MIGRTLSHFRILEALGAGGMGVVYRARDEHLGRDVAIKLLPTGLLDEAEARRQFHGEARILSRLNHPNIGMVFEFGSQDGIDFLVLELVPGETLSSRIARGSLPEREIGLLGEQLSRGLSAAHRSGVLHRDIKPANLRLTPEGTLKILDFGLARVTLPVPELTRTKTISGGTGVAGTIPYMSPEQLRQRTLDARSDIHAAGAVLYEMACGRRAFPQEDAATVIAAILGERPAPPSAIAPGVSKELEQIITRCLEKDPRERYQSAEDLSSDLHQLALPASQRRLSPSPVKLGGRGLRAAGLTLTALATAAALIFGFDLGGVRHRLFPAPAAEAPSLAVLPLGNVSGDHTQDYFADGITDELITRLAQIPTLKVISRSSTMQYRDTKKAAPQIARELGVKMLVQGTVQRAGDRVRIRAQLVDATKDRNLWGDTFEGSAGNVFALQSDAARAIVDRIRLRLTSRDRARLTHAAAISPEAHDAYLRGRYAIDRLSGEQIGSAVESFSRAVRLEPGYAQAWAGLANAYYLLSSTYVNPEEVIPKARAAAKRAIELDPDLAEAHASLAVVSYLERDWRSVERESHDAIRLDPSSATAHLAYAGFLQIQGQLEKAQGEYDRARDLDPLSNDNGAVWCTYLRGHYDEAIARLNDMARLAPRDPQTWYNLGQSYTQKGQYAKAIDALHKAVALADAPWPLGMLGHVYALAGQRDSAQAVLDRMQKSGHLPPYCFALVYAGLGDHDRCFEWLERAYATRDDNINNLKVDPAFKSVRSDGRFASLIRRLGLGA